MRILTVVASLLLSVSTTHAQQGSVHFFGTEVTPLGAATVSVAGGQLVVGNLGSSGSDGFHVNTGGGQGMYLAWPQPLPVGSQMRFDIHTTSPILEPCIIIAPGAANTSLLPDFSSWGAASYRAEVWQGDQFIGAATIAGTQAVFSSAAVMEIEVDIAGGVAGPQLPPPLLPAPAPFEPSFLIRLDLDGLSTIDHAGGLIGVGDELRLLCTKPQGSGVSEVIGNDVGISLAGPGIMEFIDLAQLSFKRRHRVIGTGTLIHEQGGIGLVPTGSINTMTLSACEDETHLGVIRAEGLGIVGESDEFSVVGELITGGSAVVGRMMRVCSGASWSLTPDFSGSLSPTAHVQLFNAAGILVAQSPSVTTAITIGTNVFPVESGVDATGFSWGLTLSCEFPNPVPITLPGAGTFTAQRIVMHSNAARRHKFFRRVELTQVGTGGVYMVLAEENGVHFQGPLEGQTAFQPQSHNRGTDAWTTVDGGAYLKRRESGLLVSTNQPAGTHRVDFEPMIPPDGFAVQWAPLGPPSATTGETDWAFLSKLATDPIPVRRMGLHLDSNGSVVILNVDPGASPTTVFRVLLRNAAGAVVTQFDTGPGQVAELGDWPIAAGYTRLVTPNEPWSMFLYFGYECAINLPASVGSEHASQVFASHIEIRAVNTPHPGPSVVELLSAELTNVPFMLFLDEPPIMTAVRDTPVSSGAVLHPAYPNPFNPATTVVFDLPASGHVSLEIFSVRGEHVATLYRGWISGGRHTMKWSGVDQRGDRVASGVYLARLRTADGAQHAKLNLLK